MKRRTMFDFTAQERTTGQCRCGQDLWTMPMINCPRKYHHTPGLIPSNPASPFHRQWIANNRQPLRSIMTEQENLPPMYRDDADPETVEKARMDLSRVVSAVGIAEAMHMEAWLSAVNRISPAEHEEAAQWLGRRRDGQDVGPAPVGLTKLKDLPPLDEHFWDCCERFRMFDTEVRWDFVRRLAMACVKAGLA